MQRRQIAKRKQNVPLSVHLILMTGFLASDAAAQVYYVVPSTAYSPPPPVSYYLAPSPVPVYAPPPAVSRYVPAVMDPSPRTQIERYYFVNGTAPSQTGPKENGANGTRRSHNGRTIIREYYYTSALEDELENLPLKKLDAPKKLVPPSPEEALGKDATPPESASTPDAPEATPPKNSTEQKDEETSKEKPAEPQAAPEGSEPKATDAAVPTESGPPTAPAPPAEST